MARGRLARDGDLYGPKEMSTCGGEYETEQHRHTQYFHVCPPIEIVTVDRGGVEHEVDRKDVQRDDREIRARTAPRPNGRDENVRSSGSTSTAARSPRREPKATAPRGPVAMAVPLNKSVDRFRPINPVPPLVVVFEPGPSASSRPIRFRRPRLAATRVRIDRGAGERGARRARKPSAGHRAT